MELVFERTGLREMARADTPHGSLDLPVVDTWRVRTGLRVPDGRTALVCASREGGRWHLLLVEPRRVSLGD